MKSSTSPEQEPKRGKRKKSIPQKILDFFSSYGLTSALLLLLIVIVIKGTVAQKDMGLFLAQKEFFESYLFYFAFDLTADLEVLVPFPGGMTVMGLLFINLVCSFFTKFQWKKRKVGLLISHMGLLLLFLGGFSTYVMEFQWFKNQYGPQYFEGQVVLFKPDPKKPNSGSDKASSAFSYYYHELVVQTAPPNGEPKVVLFPQSELREEGELELEDFPFELEIIDYMENSVARQVPNQQPGAKPGQMSVVLEEREPVLEFENNQAGIVVKVNMNNRTLGEVHLRNELPVSFRIENETYYLALRKERYPFPFTIKLLSTDAVYHPGTAKPMHYESRVEVIDGESKREVLITMNNPLRYRGYTFYQSGFDENNGNPKSALAVVRNPAAVMPYLSSLLVLIGLVIHFTQKLMRFLNRRTPRRKEVTDSSSEERAGEDVSGDESSSEQADEGEDTSSSDTEDPTSSEEDSPSEEDSFRDDKKDAPEK